MLDSAPKTVKKTVVLWGSMDVFIRKTWATLIEQGYDATYSTAVNWMLLALVLETGRDGIPRGLSSDTKQALKGLMDNPSSTAKLNLDDRLANIREFWGLDQ